MAKKLIKITKQLLKVALATLIVSSFLLWIRKQFGYEQSELIGIALLIGFSFATLKPSG